MLLPSSTTGSSLPAACGAKVVTYARSVPRKEIYLLPQHAATVCWRKEKSPIPQNIGAVDTRRMRCRKSSRRGHPGLQRGGCSLTTWPPQACPSRRLSEARQRNSRSLGHLWWQVPKQWSTGSLRLQPNTNRSVSSGSKSKQFVSGQNIVVVVTVVQQIMTESNVTVLEESKILVITKIVLNLREQNGQYNS
jgi:hypothetical protein